MFRVYGFRGLRHYYYTCYLLLVTVLRVAMIATATTTTTSAAATTTTTTTTITTATTLLILLVLLLLLLLLLIVSILRLRHPVLLFGVTGVSGGLGLFRVVYGRLGDLNLVQGVQGGLFVAVFVWCNGWLCFAGFSAFPWIPTRSPIRQSHSASLQQLSFIPEAIY